MTAERRIRLQKTAAIVFTLLMLVVGTRYSYLTWHGDIQPTFATWVLFGAGTTLSFWTYWSTKEHSLLSNIVNVLDMLTVGAILTTIVMCGKNIRWAFNGFELTCLLVCGLILVFWRWSRRHSTSNLATQAVMTVAYFPTLYHLWYASENSEPFGPWIVTWFAAVTAVIPAVLGKDKLAMVYAGRGCVLVTTILLFMARLHFR